MPSSFDGAWLLWRSRGHPWVLLLGLLFFNLFLGSYIFLILNHPILLNSAGGFSQKLHQKQCQINVIISARVNVSEATLLSNNVAVQRTPKWKGLALRTSYGSASVKVAKWLMVCPASLWCNLSVGLMQTCLYVSCSLFESFQGITFILNVFKCPDNRYWI